MKLRGGGRVEVVGVDRHDLRPRLPGEASRNLELHFHERTKTSRHAPSTAVASLPDFALRAGDELITAATGLGELRNVAEVAGPQWPEGGG